MSKKNQKANQKDSNKIAENNYDPSYYNEDGQFEQGLAETHEQVSDDYHEGTIDRKLGKED
nr:YozQ family protein [Alkalibacillus aidingensis]